MLKLSILKILNAIELLFLSCWLQLGADKEVLASRQLFDYDDRESRQVQVFLKLSDAISEIDNQFLSIALDTSLIINHWKSVDFNSKRLNVLARALSPAHLRLGGNAADFLIFRKELGKNTVNLDPKLYEENYDGKLGYRNISEFDMTAQDFEEVNKFAMRNNLSLLFDFNVLLRNAEGQWNSSNAYEILKYAIEKAFDKNLLFSLGNEPNSFRHAYNRTLPATQLGKDFVTLYHLLRNDPSLAQHFHNSLLVGPDVTQPKKQSLQYLNEFLSVASSKINAITFHQYYVDGRTATIDDMMSEDVLDILTDELDKLHASLSDWGYSNYTLWMGETGSCWGGGASGLSDRYVAGFMWLDKLGLAARSGVRVVIRQSFVHGHYALLDREFYPNPDYWLSWLFKNLVGTKVFMVDVQASSGLRLYAHCSKYPWYNQGAVTLFGLNLDNRNVTLTFDKYLMEQEKHLYWLYPHGHKGLKSREVQLSSDQLPLQLTDDYTLPVIHPTIIPAGKGVAVGGYSFGFIVFPDSRTKECLHN